jgi:hypothetical protein
MSPAGTADDGVVIQTVVEVAVIAGNTFIVAAWAFRPNHYRTGRLPHRWTGPAPSHGRSRCLRVVPLPWPLGVPWAS